MKTRSTMRHLFKECLFKGEETDGLCALVYLVSLRSTHTLRGLEVTFEQKRVQEIPRNVESIQ